MSTQFDLTLNDHHNANLAKRCIIKPSGSIIHEFIHAWGFDHEHNRKDRDEYVTISRSALNDTNFEKNHDSRTFNVPYDGGSIMHYGLRGDMERSVSALLDSFKSLTRLKNISVLDAG